MQYFVRLHVAFCETVIEITNKEQELIKKKRISSEDCWGPVSDVVSRYLKDLELPIDSIFIKKDLLGTYAALNLAKLGWNVVLTGEKSCNIL